ncbi:hypothetical protein EV202_1263 [Bacteroides heparinolyticus]|uniref:DUF4919 domain-containing protein n=1 Tax=Prevotella heparinolytica TaxID=28113 RepID=A0A4R2M2D9_9BACE|nr:hypothetical protein [Bacteroides heparinolyticus]TCO88343.1 hypothetical protein EV202_1263 [Bacteroides heparinolyticus]
MKRYLLFFILICSACVFTSCEKNDTEADYEFTDTSVNGKSFYSVYEELRMRMIFGLANPDASYNDPDKIYELLTALGKSQTKTRGTIAQVKAGYDFYKAMESSTALPRYAALGVIKKAGINIKDSKVRRELFGAIDPDHLPKNYNVKDFWADFSTGKLDRYAPAIFKDIYYTGGLSGHGSEHKPYCEAFQNYCDQCHIRPIDLAITAAPKLIQAGVGLVIATSDDLIQWGESAYNFVNDNGELLISFADGNLDGAKLSKACNTNFKLLTTVLKSTLAETYNSDLLDAEKDFLDILGDWTQEQVAELNKSVNELIQDRLGSKYELLDSDLEDFAERIKEIASSGNGPEQYLIQIGKWISYDEGGVAILVFKANHTGTITEYILDDSYEGGFKKEREIQIKWKLSGDTLSITGTDEDGKTETVVLKFSIKEGAFHLTNSDGETVVLYPYKNGQGFS